MLTRRQICQNVSQFWRLLGEVLGGAAAHELTYGARLERAAQHGIGIWDVLTADHREGSLDSAIHKPTISMRCACMRRS